MLRAQIGGVPPEYAPTLEGVSFATGVPRSWLAAVCELAGWNPGLNELDPVNDYGRQAVRRFGLAGIWASIKELTLQHDPSLPGGYPCPGTGSIETVYAGWAPAISTTVFAGLPCPCPGVSLQYEPVANLTVAANILKQCGNEVLASCGEYNELIFLKWMFGCSWHPTKDAQGRCVVPAGLPDLFHQEIEALVLAQALYAEQYGDAPIVPIALVVAISANALEAPPGEPITFTVIAAGGRPPYTFTWDFGDGTPTVETAGLTIAHSYQSEGTYVVRATATDTIGQRETSGPLTVTITPGAPPPPPPPPAGGSNLLWLGLLGLAGLVGLAALAGKKSKRQQAQEKRRKAQELRSRASQERLKGNNAGAANMEAEATRLEQEATQLEAEAAREEALKYQLQKPR